MEYQVSVHDLRNISLENKDIEAIVASLTAIAERIEEQTRVIQESAPEDD